MPVLCEAPVDWKHEARTLICAGFGVRETARKLGQDEDKVKQWAWRNGIVAGLQKAKAEFVTKLPSVTTAAVVLADSLAENGKASQFAIAKRGKLVLEAALERAHDDPEKALQESPLIAAEVKSQQGANVPGFERQPEATASMVVNLALLGADPVAMDVSCDPMFQ